MPRFGLFLALLVMSLTACETTGQYRNKYNPFHDPQSAPRLAEINALKKEIREKDTVKIASQWRKVVAMGPDAAFTMLYDGGVDPITANWYRTAIDAIFEIALREKQAVPTQWLSAYLEDTKGDPSFRRLAYEWLCRFEPTTPEKWLPKLLNDPSPELRREAVAVELEKAEKFLAAKDEGKAKEAFQKLLSHARDSDQVETIAKHLEKSGVKVDLAQHFGSVTSWHVIGPFDNTEEKGFGVVYQPERGVDTLALVAKYEGKKGEALFWKPHRTELKYGVVDLNKAIGKHMAAVGYAYTVVDIPRGGWGEIRVGSQNSVQVFLNGKQVIAHDEYHNGYRMDQFCAQVPFKTGKNEILVKLCQNNQKESWAQDWKFQLRLCDGVGTPLPFKVISPFSGDARSPSAEWPQFRGPGGLAVSAEKGIPIKWSETENVRWKAKLPGKGLSNPVIAGGRVYVTACSGFLQDRLHILCFDVKTGEKRWERQLWATGNTNCNPKTNMAAPTPVTDGERVYALFATADLVCFDKDGNMLWYRPLCKEHPSITNQVGMAASPILHQDRLILPMENYGTESFIAALDKQTGKNLWSVKRPKEINWTTPLVFCCGDKTQIVFQSSKDITAYDFLTGEIAWTVTEKDLATMASPALSQGLVISPGNTFTVIRPEAGQPKPQMVWKTSRLKLAYCTPVVFEGNLYALTNNGILSCWQEADGKQLWQTRLPGTFAASPVIIDGKVYALSEDGVTHVVQPGKEPQVLASNKLPGTNFLATPAVADAALFLRSDNWLYCISGKTR